MRQSLALVIVAAALAVCVTSGQTAPGQSAQSQPSGTALITGRVIDADGGVPVAGAIVTILGGGLPPGTTRVLTDAEGRFFFSNIVASTVNLTATKAGYLEGAFGQKRPMGQKHGIDLSEGARRNDVTISLWRNAVISGRVVDETGDPFVGIDVRLVNVSFAAGYRQTSLGARVVTDDRGAFRFAAIPPGDYLVVVPAIVTSEPTAFAGSVRSGLDIPREYMQTMTAVGSAPIIKGSDRADGVTGGGRALISGLTGVPSMPPVDGVWLTHATTFYPSATSVSSAASVHAAAGQDRRLTDLVLKLVPTFQVSGTVSVPGGSAAFHAVHLVQAESADLPLLDTATAITDADGTFTFYGVPAGSYLARIVRTPYPTQGRLVLGSDGSGPLSVFSSSSGPATSGPAIPTEPLLHATVPVTVTSRDVRGLSLQMRPGARVSGRVEFDGTGDRPTAAQLKAASISLQLANGRPDDGNSTGRIADDGSFATPSLWPGRYLVRMTSPLGKWTLKSATSGGHDVSDTPLDVATDVSDVVITLTDHAAEIRGTAQGADGLSGADAVVLMFPSDPASWKDYGRTSRRLRSVFPLPAGSFSLPLPPDGEYLVVAFPEGSEEWLNWRDPAFLEKAAPLAERVQVRGGQPVTCNPAMKRIPR